MPTYEGLRLKILKFRRKKFANLRRKKIENENFTIISNNCWGGMIYESYNIVKQTPTVGLFFLASDYIKFITNIKEYLNKELNFISVEQSKWKDRILKEKKAGSFPIGKLDDIEIFFLHYHSEDEAKEKWNRRKERINWDRILFKFNDQNGCTVEDYVNFMNLPYKNKVFFTCKDWPSINGEKKYIKINQFPKHEFIMASYEPFGKSYRINVNELINNLKKDKL